MLQGLQTGHATLGVVGTVSPWLVPPLVAEIARVAPGVSLRLTEGASERLAVEVAERELAFAVVTEPVTDTRLVVEHLRDEALVGLLPADLDLGVPEPVPLAALARTRLDPAARRATRCATRSTSPPRPNTCRCAFRSRSRASG